MKLKSMINKIHNESCLETMSKINDEEIDIILTSPPYNIGSKRKDCYYNNGYNDIDNLTQEEYLTLRTNEFKEFERILVKNGVILYNISYHNQNPILPTLLISKIHNETNFTVADIIIWKKSNSIPFQTSPTKLSRICELIYVVVNKDYLHTFKTNKEISKINEKTKQKFYKNYTNLIEASNNDECTTLNKATFSSELCEKLLKIYCKEESIVYDPFIGTGTTAVACLKNKISFIGSEISKDQVEYSNNRLLKWSSHI